MKWDRVEPTESCDSPDGHSMFDFEIIGSTVPEATACTRCGRPGQIVERPACPVCEHDEHRTQPCPDCPCTWHRSLTVAGEELNDALRTLGRTIVDTIPGLRRLLHR